VLAAPFTKCYTPRRGLALQVGTPKKRPVPGFSEKCASRCMPESWKQNESPRKSEESVR